jgi:hypothetical protein
MQGDSVGTGRDAQGSVCLLPQPVQDGEVFE